MEVNKRKQLHYLERKYKQLTKQYLRELTDGTSLAIIKDLSFVLHSLEDEIQMLQNDLKKSEPIAYSLLKPLQV
jgi:hypothetical protein